MALAACGGGSSGSVGGGGGGVTPATPTPVATATPTAAPVGNVPQSEAVGGSQAFVNPANHKTLYFLDVDTPTGGTCVAGCISVWPPLTPTAGSAAIGNMAMITRSDGTGQQWTYQGHPLYTFTLDNGADQTNGDNFPDFGGHWHVARPVQPTPPPVGTPQPCVGQYC